jgi:hypothetical protein
VAQPPYFNLEMYTAAGESAGEASQSHVRFPEASWWVQQFLGKLIGHAATGLRCGGFLLLNVANNRMLRDAGLDLEYEVAEHARRAGLRAERTLRMLKPRAPGTSGCGGVAAEPILVFRKPEAPRAPSVAGVPPKVASAGEGKSALVEGDALSAMLGSW